MKGLEYRLLMFALLLVIGMIAVSPGAATAQEPTPTATVAPYIQTYTVDGQEVVIKYLVEAGDFAVVTVLSLLLFVNVLMLVVMTLRKRYQ